MSLMLSPVLQVPVWLLRGAFLAQVLLHKRPWGERLEGVVSVVAQSSAMLLLGFNFRSVT